MYIRPMPPTYRARFPRSAGEGSIKGTGWSFSWPQFGWIRLVTETYTAELKQLKAYPTFLRHNTRDQHKVPVVLPQPYTSSDCAGTEVSTSYPDVLQRRWIQHKVHWEPWTCLDYSHSGPARPRRIRSRPSTGRKMKWHLISS